MVCELSLWDRLARFLDPVEHVKHEYNEHRVAFRKSYHGAQGIAEGGVEEFQHYETRMECVQVTLVQEIHGRFNNCSDIQIFHSYESH